MGDRAEEWRDNLVLRLGIRKTAVATRLCHIHQKVIFLSLIGHTLLPILIVETEKGKEHNLFTFFYTQHKWAHFLVITNLSDITQPSVLEKPRVKPI